MNTPGYVLDSQYSSNTLLSGNALSQSNLPAVRPCCRAQNGEQGHGIPRITVFGDRHRLRGGGQSVCAAQRADAPAAAIRSTLTLTSRSGTHS
jgi:hypothetical protein